MFLSKILGLSLYIYISFFFDEEMHLEMRWFHIIGSADEAKSKG